MKFSGQILGYCLVYCVLQTAYSTEQGNLCFTPDNFIGVCVPLPYCASLVEVYARNGGSRQISLEVVDYLRDARRNCGYKFTGGAPVICCSEAYKVYQRSDFYEPQTTNYPSSTISSAQTILPNSGFWSIPTRQTFQLEYNTPRQKVVGCRGPDARQGVCKNLASCPELWNRFQSNPDDESFAQILRQSNAVCLQSAPIVCCPNMNSGSAYVAVSSDSEANLGSWAWIALLGYSDNFGKTDYRCGGALITNRHVVTAAHCITSDLRTVRLGENDLSTDSEAEHIDVNVVRKVRHPSFNLNSDNYADIGILHMSRTIKFSDKIRLISFPMMGQYASRSLIGSSAFVAGWGATRENGPSSMVLQQVQIPILSNDVCRVRLPDVMQTRFRSSRQFDDSIICAGDLNGVKDSCNGDSGGPLILAEKSPNTNQFNYTLIGIVSHSVLGCSRPGFPASFTSISYYSDWIRQQISERL